MTTPPSPRSRAAAIETAIVVLAGCALFLLRFGWLVLDPRQVAWLLAREDPASYFLVWDFFRHEAWTFPLGQVTGYLYPLGASLPLVDGLPLLAYPFKLISPLLPPVFQFFGFWHLLCAVLQAIFGYLIVRRCVAHRAGRLLATLLFLLAPVYLYREGHIALSSHWLLLAAIHLYLGGDDGGWRRVTVRWCALCALTALVHPYLVAMVGLVFLGAMLRRAPASGWAVRLATMAAAGATVLAVWWVAGNLAGLNAERARAEGFGYFSLNLNGLFNPIGYGTLLPDLPRGRGQYEGYAYLGAGWILLAAVGLLGLCWRRVRESLRPHRALVWILVGTYAYALSNVVMWREAVVLQYALVPVLDLPTGIFRCSGRFVWPVIYAGMTGLACFVGRFRRPWLAVVLLAAALTLQVVDLRPLIFQRDHFASLRFASRLTDPNWETAANAASAITALPPFQFSLVQRADYRDICALASRHRVPTTAGYTARMSATAIALRDSLRLALASGTADTTQLYVCDGPWYAEALAGLGDRYVGAVWDDYFVCHPRDWPLAPRPGYTAARCASLADFLGERPHRTLVLAVRDEATAGLTAADRAALRDIGFAEAALVYRGAAVAVVHHGEVVWQQLEPARRVALALAPGDSVGDFRAARTIAAASAGFDAGNEAQLRLDGREEGFNGRGFNILVLDDDQRVVEAAWFDTFAGTPGVVLRPTLPR